ncbi:dienelactone hydrolase family protein [Sphingomonas sp. BK580]|uniref:dienelactone hydrolase family protein n=1 Tax=Sphingomonas sp. BK580 TaxID=2586972 RepID=UPI00160AB729|nr:dienelactone hydrolase family protein [Sphingomonas sp. BK580]MBB3695630.1 carboxymethylenebutenolidase [Sphingomonas sp. BK580]
MSGETALLGRLVDLTATDGAPIAAYHVEAQAPRRGGLVLIQEIFGLTTHIREQCDRFAREGYDVLAPAIFDREAPGLDLGYAPEEVAEAIRLVRAHPLEQTLTDADLCIEQLAAAGPVFMTGYCYGGSASYVMACRSTRLTAAACYYGSMIPSRAHERPLCPVLVHFGREDVEIPMDAVEAFRDARPDVEVQLYPAGHGFNSDRRDDYDAASARLAFERTLAFFDAASAAR